MELSPHVSIIAIIVRTLRLLYSIQYKLVFHEININYIELCIKQRFLYNRHKTIRIY